MTPLAILPELVHHMPVVLDILSFLCLLACLGVLGLLGLLGSLRYLFRAFERSSSRVRELGKVQGAREIEPTLPAAQNYPRES